MNHYKCGHEGKPVFLHDNVVEFAVYLTWKDSTGYDGDKSECFPCYCKRTKKQWNAKGECEDAV